MARLVEAFQFFGEAVVESFNAESLKYGSDF